MLSSANRLNIYLGNKMHKKGEMFPKNDRQFVGRGLREAVEENAICNLRLIPYADGDSIQADA